MIRYALRCSDGHDFESWFRDSAAYDTLYKAGQISCTTCGSTTVEKTIMAPAVSGSRGARQSTPNEASPLSTPATPEQAALSKFREHLEKNSDYVGGEFAAEARKIHQGDADARSIWGEATPADAKKLHEDGVPVAPLPFISRRND